MSNDQEFDAKEHFGDKHSTIYDEKIRARIRGQVLKNKFLVLSFLYGPSTPS